MFTEQEKATIQKYFGQSVQDLSKEDFATKQKQLRAKYHPDNFAKYDDETVVEMATDRFQLLEAVMKKMQDYYDGKIKTPALDPSAPTELYRHSAALFAARKLKIEVITRNKDLKYLLFGRRYRWLMYGETFKIPKTDASLVMDQDHRGTSIGYQESVRFYLTFGESQPIEAIVEWLFGGIAQEGTKLLIAGDKVEVNKAAIQNAIQKHTFLRLTE
ncbi:MAG: hypothetical protein AB8G22_00630 [Saprospiraceae bacterium]